MRAVLAGGFLVAGALRLRAAVGRGGVRAAKREGDGATPAGVMPLRRVLYRADRLSAPVCAVPAEALRQDDGWCDDVAHADYNHRICLPHGGRHEMLWRDDGLYDVIGVLGWNDDPVVPGRGSAIFLHVATPDYAPTAGCIALSPDDVIALLSQGISEIEIKS